MEKLHQTWYTYDFNLGIYPQTLMAGLIKISNHIVRDHSKEERKEVTKIEQTLPRLVSNPKSLGLLSYIRKGTMTVKLIFSPYRHR